MVHKRLVLYEGFVTTYFQCDTRKPAFYGPNVTPKIFKLVCFLSFISEVRANFGNSPTL